MVSIAYRRISSDWAQEGKKKGFKTNLLDVDLSYIEYRTQLWDKYNVDSGFKRKGHE